MHIYVHTVATNRYVAYQTYIYFNEKSNNELAFIKSAGYAEVPSSVLLVTKAKLEIK